MLSDLALRNCYLTADLTVKVGDYGIGPYRYKVSRNLNFRYVLHRDFVFIIAVWNCIFLSTPGAGYTKILYIRLVYEIRPVVVLLLNTQSNLLGYIDTDECVILFKIAGLIQISSGNPVSLFFVVTNLREDVRFYFFIIFFYCNLTRVQMSLGSSVGCIA